MEERICIFWVRWETQPHGYIEQDLDHMRKELLMGLHLNSLLNCWLILGSYSIVVCNSCREKSGTGDEREKMPRLLACYYSLCPQALYHLVFLVDSIPCSLSLTTVLEHQLWPLLHTGKASIFQLLIPPHLQFLNLPAFKMHLFPLFHAAKILA